METGFEALTDCLQRGVAFVTRDFISECIKQVCVCVCVCVCARDCRLVGK